MKKSFLLLASFSLGTAAIAQDAMQPAPASPPMAPDSAAPGMTGTAPGAGAAAVPEDARAGAVGTTSSPAPAMSGSSAGDMKLPRCSRTVTDKCMSGGGMTKRKAPKR